MKIVLLEDYEPYRESLRQILSYSLEDIDFQVERDLIEGGLFDVSLAVMQGFKPPRGEKTIILVDANLDYTPNGEDAVPGNGFKLVTQWIEHQVITAKQQGDEAAIDNLQHSVEIILNPGSRQSLSEGFDPNRRLREVMAATGVRVVDCYKSLGPQSLLNEIRRFERGNIGVEGVPTTKER